MHDINLSKYYFCYSSFSYRLRREYATHKQSYDTLIGGGGGGSLHFFTQHFFVCFVYGVVKIVVKKVH